jgi:hypothetical protein
LGLAIGGWLTLLGGIYAGGLDPSAEDYNTLRSVMAFVLVAECLAIPLGFVGIIIGPHRLASVFAMLIAGSYFLYFTGMLFMFYTA